MWSLMAAPDGTRFLMNLDNVIGFGENKLDGTAVAISITGMAVPLGVQLDQVIADYSDPPGDGDAAGDIDDGSPL